MPTTRLTRCISTLRVLTGVFFCYSGITKIIDLPTFHNAVINFQLVDGQAADWITFLVPVAETLLGITLMLNIMTLGSSALLAAMMGAFTLAIAIAWSRGLNISCGCFGKLSEGTVNYPLKIASNIGIIALLAILFGSSLRPSGRSRQPHASSTT